MSNHTATDYIDHELSTAGHTATIVYVVETRTMGLHCDECRWFGGSFRPDRWRDKHMSIEFNKHLIHAATGAKIEHGRAANIAEGICRCVTCSIAYRMAKLDASEAERAHA